MARLHSNLSRIAAKCPQAASAALIQTGKDIYELSQQLVPVDTSSLKRSGGSVAVSSTVVHVGYGSPGVFIDGREPEKYAEYVEYGTVHSPAQPYLTRAFLQSQTTFNKRLTDEMKKLEGVS